MMIIIIIIIIIITSMVIIDMITALFITLKEREKNEQEVQLFIRQVGWDHFRKYTLVVENVISISTCEVFLRESEFLSLGSILFL